MGKERHFNKNYMRRFAWSACLFLALIYGMSSLAAYQSIRDQRVLVEAQQNQAVQTFHRELVAHMGRVSNDMKVLTGDPIFQTFLTGEEKNRGLVISDWIDFMQISGQYHHIAYINLQGQEEIRVNSRGSEAYGVSEVHLQNIESSTFYQEAVNVRKNYMYFSSVKATQADSAGSELNAAVPLYDLNGYKRGLFQLNYRTEILSLMMTNHEQIFDTQLFLIQEDGLMFCSLGGGCQSLNIDPSEVEISKILISDQRTGQFETSKGLFTYEKLSPGQLSTEIGNRISLNDEEWVLIAHASPDVHGFLNGLEDWQNALMEGRHDLRRYGFIAVLSALLIAELMRHLWNSKETERASERRVERISSEYDDLMDALLEMLKQASIMTSQEHERHGARMSAYAEQLARHSNCKADFIGKIKTYAPIYDIGKIGINQAILSKKGELNYKEFNEVIQHVQIGYNLIKHLKLGVVAENLVLYHHERWDGNGYLYSLEAEQIPLEARIMAIADTYDALRMDKPQRRGMSHEAAISILTEGKGSKYDPHLIDILIKKQGDFYRIFEQNK